ncbi:tripartite tricarboxylate transporter substrate binding protein [Siccirubricoccus sp. KC 17139]|uniref:Tripartite tricarboxylate transporter substrate binding protein n=1 Tax=Siccirubricoccus soli TaxID=2899147 RepID=A0ABT1CZ40_9PROT|nr:tripartite tricarboxylate transporter substrate binding protein [Siccirubricoccus soli]MCO6414941.1 tripartite tricarboxylate transporter substrate binding protein [Siccirubricoccus soli]MCP2681072.1 tripartite tricarboxylate transporter substrate binding protein [Siccirubricoccus soli]
MKSVTRRAALGGAGSLLLAPRLSAQPAWPSRPVRIIVPFSAAGTTDIVARLLVEPLTARLGQSVVVENRPGAGGNIGADAVAKATDNHTLLMTTIGTAAINYGLYRTTMPYKPEDLAAVSNIAGVPNVIIAAPNLPVKTLAEAVALAKRRSGGLTIASSGNGTSLHLTGELLKQVAGIELVHVPFRGSGPMLTEVIASRVDLAVDNLPSSLGHIRDNRVKALTVTTPQRSPAVPEVPTTAEAGYPALDATAWFGIQAPSRMPKEIVARLSQELQAIVKEPAMRAKIAEQGAVPIGDTPEQFQAFIDSEIARWGEVIRKANISLE